LVEVGAAIQQWVSYLLRLGVGITAVVDESGNVSFLRSINNLIRVEGHEIIMAVLVTGILLHSMLELFVSQYLANIFPNKLTTAITMTVRARMFLQSYAQFIEHNTQ